MLIVLFATFLVLLLTGIPVAYALGLASALYIFVDQSTSTFPQPWQQVPATMVSGAGAYGLLVIPLFILVGELMNRGEITPKLVRFASSLIGHWRGGLAQVTVGVNFLMAGMSGSALADTSATGSVMIPALKKAGYPRSFAAAITAAASTIGPIFPPSAPLAIVGALVGVSVGKLFIGGIVPGVLIAIALMVFVAVTSRRRGYPKGDDFSMAEVARSGLGALAPFMLPVVLVGSILFGYATPTEAGTLGVLYAAGLGIVYRALSLKGLLSSLVSVGLLTSVIIFVVSTANILGVLAGINGFGQLVTDSLLSVSSNPIILLLLINVIVLILGLAIEPLPLTLVLVPLLYPVVTSVGIDPIHFGVVITLNLMLAMLTPPVAMLTFIAAKIADADVAESMKDSLPMFWTLVCVLILITIFPDLVTWLPNHM